MKPAPKPLTWPKLLSLADYARACAQVTGRSVSRQAIHARLQAGSLAVAPTGLLSSGRTKYIDTEQYPPGAAPGPHAHRKKASTP